MKRILLLLVVLMLVFTSCSTNTDSFEEKIFEANSNVTSFTMDSEISITLISSEDIGDFDYSMDIFANVDRSKQMMYMESNMDSALTPEPIELTSYIMDGYMYYEMMGSWFKAEFDTDMLDSQDQFEQLFTTFSNGNLTILDDETVDGVKYHVVMLSPTIDMLLESPMMKDSFSSEQVSPEEIASLIDAMSYKMWINSDSFLIEMYELTFEMDLSQTAENSVISSNLNAKFYTKTKFSNFGEKFDFTLPEGAKENAVDISSLVPN